ncbi:MAG: hypothetical protein H7840_12920 [Alphaproteobacteria bacterium]
MTTAQAKGKAEQGNRVNEMRCPETKNVRSAVLILERAMNGSNFFADWTGSGGNVRHSMIDIGLAAFSVFQMQCPSFLQHQNVMAEERGRSNAHTCLDAGSRRPGADPAGRLGTLLFAQAPRPAVLDPQAERRRRRV